MVTMTAARARFLAFGFSVTVLALMWALGALLMTHQQLVQAQKTNMFEVAVTSYELENNQTWCRAFVWPVGQPDSVEKHETVIRTADGPIKHLCSWSFDGSGRLVYGPQGS